METNEQMNVEQNVEEIKEEPAKAKEPKTRTYTDAEVDEIINKRFAKWQKEQDRKVEEAKRLEQMNAEEKAKYERDALQKELDELKAERNRNEMLKTARKMLSNDGVEVGDDLIVAIIKDDAEATNLAVKELAKMYKRDVANGVRAELGGNAPKKGGSSALTREQIFAIKDPNQRLKAIEENMDIFRKEK